MAMSERRKEYFKEYRAEKVKRIPLDVKPQFYEAVKKAAEAEGVSVNGLIKRVVGIYLMKKR